MSSLQGIDSNKQCIADPCCRLHEFCTCNVQAAAASFVSEHNKELAAMLASFNATHTGVSASVYDVNGFFVDLVTNYASYGFTTAAPCLMAESFFPGFSQGFANTVCADPNVHIFWDAVHLSKHGMALLAADFVSSNPQLQMN